VVVQCIGSNGIAFFFEPFSSILSKLTAGTARGRECFEDRKRFAADKTIVTCRLSSYDFFVIRKVDVQQQARHIASIKEKVEESDGPWKKHYIISFI
jgi:hypothetical protein